MLIDCKTVQEIAIAHNEWLLIDSTVQNLICGKRCAYAYALSTPGPFRYQWTKKAG